MTLFEEIEPVIKEQKEVKGITLNTLNELITSVKDIMFVKYVEIFTCTSIKTIEGKKLGIRVIVVKCKGKRVFNQVSYNYPSDKNRSETIVLINALQIARFINSKLKYDIVIYNNSEYALDFVTERKYIKNTNNDIYSFFKNMHIKEIDFAKIKKIHRKDNIDKLYCKEICQIKNLK